MACSESPGAWEGLGGDRAVDRIEAPSLASGKRSVYNEVPMA